MTDLTNKESKLMEKILEEASFNSEMTNEIKTITDHVSDVVKTLSPIEKSLYQNIVKKITTL